ncbi:MAG: threonine/serine exporter family protein [Mucispirillum sp.]|nr:threonine/serine exporter family protein [Mucispirillum sp.]
MKTADIKELSNFLLDYAAMLMRSGANTERTVRNVTRISKSFGYEAAIAIFQRNITMTIQDPADSAKGCTSVKQQMPPHLSLSIVNDLSALSWQSYDTDMSLNEVKERYSEILSKAHSSNFIVLLFASFAIAAFCELFGGDYYAMLIVFLSTLVAFSLRLFLIKLRFDVRAMITVVSFTASFTAYLIGSFLISTNTLNVAVSTSVLFLIPGVHIINSVTDILDGHVMTGISRAVSSMILVICIAIGLYATLSLTSWLFL